MSIFAMHRTSHFHWLTLLVQSTAQLTWLFIKLTRITPKIIPQFSGSLVIFLIPHVFFFCLELPVIIFQVTKQNCLKFKLSLPGSKSADALRDQLKLAMRQKNKTNLERAIAECEASRLPELESDLYQAKSVLDTLHRGPTGTSPTHGFLLIIRIISYYKLRIAWVLQYYDHIFEIILC